MAYRFKAKLWRYPGDAAWHFVTLAKGTADEIRAYAGKDKRGWGDIPVEATVGSTVWRTSIFPDSKSDGFVLPIKADVRKAEGLSVNDLVDVRLELRW
jgi:hypothetical protein